MKFFLASLTVLKNTAEEKKEEILKIWKSSSNIVIFILFVLSFRPIHQTELFII